MAFGNIPDIKSVRVVYELQTTINLPFTPKNDKVFPVGAGVQLDSSTVVDTTTSGENQIGVVIADKQKDGNVTVKTNFIAVITAKAKSAITVGALLKEVGADTITNKQLTVEPAVATNYASYRALNTATNAGDELRIAVLACPIVKS
jgi:hypothetical protein